MKKQLKLDTVIGLIGLIVSIAGLIGRWELLASVIISSSGVFLIIWAIISLSGEWGDPYKHLKYIWSVSILDKSGKKSSVQLSSLLKIRRKKISEGGTWWSCFPHNLKTYISYVESGDGLLNKIEISHSNPEKRGSMYFWSIYHNPSLRKGQKVWVIDEFEMQDEYINGKICDFFDSFRNIKTFIWKFHLPPERPAKRWYGSADYLPNKGDMHILTEENKVTTEVVWEFSNTKKGAVYYINIDW